MGKIALVTKLGTHDSGVILNSPAYERQADLNLFTNGNSDIRLQRLFMQMKRLKIKPSEVAMDMLVIAISMYAADTRISRPVFAEDSWTREISLFIPVSDSQLWTNQKDLLQDIFRFLTGDIWELNFRERSQYPSLAPEGRLRRYGMSYQTDTVCLFSGGMDSFIGAINLLSQGTRPLLLGHAKSADVSPYQKNCEQALTTEFGNLHRIYAFLRIPPKEVLFNTEEKTERGRSFLFLVLGGIFASGLNSNSKNLIVPENGLISLNLPLTPLRIGSHSTRTTHPHYMKLMQQLFNNVGLEVSILNPYQYKTKGEMLAECQNSSLLQTTSTMSCSSPSSRRGEGTKHCGYCVPCLIRRASFLRANIPDPAINYKVNINASNELNTARKRDHIVAFKYLIEKQERNPNYLLSLIRTTGELGNDVSEYLSTYQRGLGEVEALLSSVTYE